MRAVSLTFALALLTTGGAPASASTIDFGDLVAGSSFTPYANSGFTVSPTSGSWMVNGYGAPSLSIVFSRAAVEPTTTAQIQITAGASPFTFSSVDLYSSITPIPYEFTGLLGGNIVFTEAGTVPNTFGTFMTVHVASAGIIDTLLITLSNPATPCCSNPVGLDNVVVSALPPTLPIPTLSEWGVGILMAFLVSVGMWSMRRSSA